jgi:hypothetical protein
MILRLDGQKVVKRNNNLRNKHSSTKDLTIKYVVYVFLSEVMQIRKLCRKQKYNNESQYNAKRNLRDWLLKD